MLLLTFKTTYRLLHFTSIRSLNLLGVQNSFNTEMSTVNLIQPSEGVQGMTVLDRRKFDTKINIGFLNIHKKDLSKVLPHLKKYLLKMMARKPVEDVGINHTKLWLNPNRIRTWNDIDELDRKALEIYDVTENNFCVSDSIITYENFHTKEIFNAVLPDEFGFSSFSQIGHIVHLNLREHLLPYKNLISQVLLDKVANARSVVNKVDIINNTYRNFEMELLCGSSDLFVSVKENYCTFEFNFSEVYWNPRLSTEHQRIVSKLNKNDVLLDIFAGVGPFAIPASKKHVLTFANDLNPHSFNWLNHNMKKNKIDSKFFKTYNKDGSDFIKTDVKELIKKYINKTNIHILMNLPALAVEFLSNFVNLYKKNEIPSITIAPIVHVYCFSKGEDSIEIAKTLVNTNIGFDISNKILEITSVRTVSNFKEMICVSFTLDEDILFRSQKLLLKRKLGDADIDEYQHGEKQSKNAEKHL